MKAVKIPLGTKGRQTQFFIGLWLIFLAAIFFSLMNLGVRFARGRFPPEALVFWRSLIQMVILLPWIREFIPKTKAERWRKGKSHLMRGGFGIISIYCLYQADQRLPLGLANLLVSTVVFWSVIFSRVFLSEKLTRAQAIWCGLASVGVIFGSLRFDGSENWGGSLLGVLAGLGSGILAGLALTILRHMRRNLETKEIVFFFGLSGVIGFLPSMWIHPRLFHSLSDLYLVLAIGLCGSVAQLFMTHSFRFLPTGVATVVHLQQTVLSAMLGCIFFAEIPPWNFALGAVVVFLAIFGLAQSQRQSF